MMANSFIDRLFPGAELKGPIFDKIREQKLLAGQLHPHLAPAFDPKQVLAPAFDPTQVLASQGTEPAIATSLAKSKETRFSGDADDVVVTGIKEIIGSINDCIAEGNFNEAINCSYTLRGLVCGYADFKCGMICALRDSKK